MDLGLGSSEEDVHGRVEAGDLQDYGPALERFQPALGLAQHVDVQLHDFALRRRGFRTESVEDLLHLRLELLVALLVGVLELRQPGLFRVIEFALLGLRQQVFQFLGASEGLAQQAIDIVQGSAFGPGQ